MKRANVVTAMPENIATRDQYKFFEPLKQFNVRIPQIKELSEVFVSHQGLVLKNGLLVRGCALNLCGKEDNTFYYPFWRNTIEQYAVCRFGKSLESIQLRGPQKYLLIHSRWFNYAFWINTYLPRLIMAEKDGDLKSMKLIYPEEWKNLAYVNQSLEAFPIQHEVIKKDVHVFVEKLVFPETRDWTNSFYPPHVKGIRQRLLHEAEKRTGNKIFPKRIYLTRAQRGVRCVENEKDVIELVKQYGFEAVTFENLSFWEQVAMMSRAESFISLHGAGFANVLFMPEGASVLELINRQYANAEYKFPFWKLSCAAGLKYHAQFCDVVNPGVSRLMNAASVKEDERNFLVNQNVFVDLDLLMKNLALFNEI